MWHARCTLAQWRTQTLQYAVSHCAEYYGTRTSTIIWAAQRVTVVPYIHFAHDIHVYVGVAQARPNYRKRLGLASNLMALAAIVAFVLISHTHSRLCTCAKVTVQHANHAACGVCALESCIVISAVQTGKRSLDEAWLLSLWLFRWPCLSSWHEYLLVLAWPLSMQWTVELLCLTVLNTMCALSHSHLLWSLLPLIRC